MFVDVAATNQRPRHTLTSEIMPIRFLKTALAMPMACVSAFVLQAPAAQAQSAGLPLFTPPNIFNGDTGPNSPPPGGSPSGANPAANRQAPTAASAGPMPSFQGGPRSLLPPSDPPVFASGKDGGLRKEASADPEVMAAAPASASSSAQPGAVAIPVPESGEADVAPRAPGSPAEVRADVQPRQFKVLPVVMDQAMVVRAPKDVRTMILGNPMIADVAAQKGGLIVVTGKMYGSTNLLLADSKGRVIGEAMIQVRPPSVNVVTVQLGTQRQSYSCTPQCLPTAVVGNEQSWFSSTSGQAQQRSQGMKQ